MWPGIDSVIWRVPWHPIRDGTSDDGLVRELRAELCPSHSLHGLEVRPVGYRQDCDDCLFELLDGTGRFAVVHLTYAQHPEPDPRWPETVMFNSWTHFDRECMKPDSEGWGQSIRVEIPFHLRTLAGTHQEIVLEVSAPITLQSVLDALEAKHPMLRGTIRDHDTKKRRDFLRFFACNQDLSNAPPDTLLPPQVAAGTEPLLIIGAIAGG